MKPIIMALAGAALALSGSALAAGTVGPGDVQFQEGSVATSLTGVAGAADAGRKVFANRKQGNCLACHANSDMTDQLFHGEVGPSLDGVADRYDEARLRGILVNSKMTFEGSIMPSFYRANNGARTMKKFQGKSILTAQQVEDVLAYIKTLKE